MDIKELIENAVEKLAKDGDLKKLFDKDPVKALEKITGKDLPDELVEKAVAGIRAKLAAGDLKDVLGGLKKLF